uniref:sphingomyelin phosphodiesterase n=1 Tax=Hirondellea gigas TaxID=1518452 RepID=A0A6A7GA21_9CRUS
MPPQTRARHSLRVLSMNVFSRPSGINDNKGNDSKTERLRILLEKIVDYDIVCLQELFSVGSRWHSDFISGAYEKGFRYFCCSTHPKFWSLKLIDGGLAILSRFPIKIRDKMVFSAGSGIDGLATKGVVYAKIRIPALKKMDLHVFTTHTQAGSAEPQWKIKETQIAEMAEFITSKVYDGLPILITGDMNTDSRRDSHMSRYQYLFGKLNEIRSPQSAIQNRIPLAETSCSECVIDLAERSYGFHPITNGYGHGVIKTDEPFNVTEDKMTVRDKKRECIDYMFFVPSAFDQALEITFLPNSTKVEPFCVFESKFSQLSDHYALKTELQLPFPIQSNNVGVEIGDGDDIKELKRFKFWKIKPCIIIGLILVVLVVGLSMLTASIVEMVEEE